MAAALTERRAIATAAISQLQTKMAGEKEAREYAAAAAARIEERRLYHSQKMIQEGRRSIPKKVTAPTFDHSITVVTPEMEERQKEAAAARILR